MSSIISERFIMAVNKLIKDNKVKSIRQFCQQISYLPQSMSQVIHGQRDVTIDVLKNTFEKYCINPIFIFMGEGNIYLDQDDQYNFKAITIVTDRSNNERIVHVPKPALAGYADGLSDIEMINELPTYTLPDQMYQSGTYRSFDVKGDSMSPTIEENDTLICSYLEPNLWDTGIRDHHVYVLVTRTDVVVKRIVNNLRRHKHLELHSDNESFQMYRLNGNDIREIWMVRSRLNRFSHSSTGFNHSQYQNEIKAYQNTIQAQSQLIESLKTQTSVN